jgi:predicted GNAT family N-acyltransferase
MPIQVETRDCAALTDADLDEMASMGAAFDIGVLSKAKEDWVLCTTARIDDKLHGCTFSTLERIGGTPCVLIGLLSVKRTSRRDAVLKGLMSEAFHRSLMAFPDEDVVIGSRFVSVDGLEGFKQVDELIPRPGHRAVGEERAWGRRLAKRFGVDTGYDEQSFVVKTNGQSGFLDHEALKADKIKPELSALFAGVNVKKGGALVVHGWVMAEDLVKLGAR